jgi:hypothetical protein
LFRNGFIVLAVGFRLRLAPMAARRKNSGRQRPVESLPAWLLDAGTEASELELLRTVALGLGVRWGRDDLGWWATVTRQE